MNIEGPLAHPVVTSGPTRERQTPPTGATRFAEVLRVGGQALVAGAQAALRVVPGGEVLCAAVRGGTTAAGSSTGISSTTGGIGRSAQNPAGPGGAQGESNGRGDLWDMTQQSQEFNLMYLQLQEELSRENRRYSALSNVLKTRHETARSVISNI